MTCVALSRDKQPRARSGRPNVALLELSGGYYGFFTQSHPVSSLDVHRLIARPRR